MLLTPNGRFELNTKVSWQYSSPSVSSSFGFGRHADNKNRSASVSQIVRSFIYCIIMIVIRIHTCLHGRSRGIMATCMGCADRSVNSDKTTASRNSFGSCCSYNWTPRLLPFEGSSCRGRRCTRGSHKRAQASRCVVSILTRLFSRRHHSCRMDYQGHEIGFARAATDQILSACLILHSRMTLLCRDP
jgi:hypothetical protein